MKQPFKSFLFSFSVLVVLCSFVTSCNESNEAITRVEYTHNSFLGVSDITVGDNRFTFVINDLQGKTLQSTNIKVEFLYKEPERLVSQFKTVPNFQELKNIIPHIHEDGEIHEHSDNKGFYVVSKANFSHPGIWIARFSIPPINKKQITIPDLAFNVKASSMVPQVGELIPRTQNLTQRDVAHIDEICSNLPPDNMHEVSIVEAIEGSLPFVVIWSAPSFCTSQICSPITRSLVKLQQLYGDKVTFIHMEPWNLQVARDEGRLIPTKELMEWNLPSEPWIFVVDSNGKVFEKCEGLISENELETSIQRVAELY